MGKLIINGGKKLQGNVAVSGAKNVALKILVAACLTDETVIIKNIPLISDFMVMVNIIKELGGEVKINNHEAFVRVKRIKRDKISLEEGAKIRTSAMFMAPLLARTGKAIIPNPGGCRIGARPIDRTIKGLKTMGFSAVYNNKDGYFYLNKNDELINSKDTVEYTFEKNTHTGTEILVMAGVLSKRKTILRNAAEEPEIDELICFLNKMGARIKRTGRREITIRGVNKLHGTSFTISLDRNEIVTFAIACIVTKGDVFIKDAHKVEISEFLKNVKEAGAGIEVKEDGIRFFYKGYIKNKNITTSFYPGFMTDWQGPWTVLMTQAKGTSIIHETVYENRFGYVDELIKMGADIKFFNPQVKNPEKIYNFNLLDNKLNYYHAIKIHGYTKLHNAVVNVSDLRAGATLVLGGLVASGESIIFGTEHLDRGYENFEERLQLLGANIKRVRG